MNQPANGGCGGSLAQQLAARAPATQTLAVHKGWTTGAIGGQAFRLLGWFRQELWLLGIAASPLNTPRGTRLRGASKLGARPPPAPIEHVVALVCRLVWPGPGPGEGRLDTPVSAPIGLHYKFIRSFASRRLQNNNNNPGIGAAN